MYLIALKMLFGDKIKLIMLLIGLMMPVMLIAQQGGMFVGFMKMFASTVDNTNAPVWIMSKNVRFADQDIPMADYELDSIRGVDGIEWAVPFINVMGNIKLPGGKSEMSVVVGVDNMSFVGLPQEIVSGNPKDLRTSDAVFVDKIGMKKLGNPKIGDTFEINEHEVKVAGIVKIPQGFQAYPAIYTTYENAKKLTPYGRKKMSFILAQPKKGEDLKVLAQRIKSETNLKMLTEDEMRWATYDYYNTDTSLPSIFGITILFGIIVGTIISAQTFYTFVLENIRQFGTFKALGTSNKTLIKMILIQSIVMATISYFIGMGLITFCATICVGDGVLAFTIPIPLMIFAFVAVVFASVLASLFGMLKVVRLEPAMVFKG